MHVAAGIATVRAGATLLYDSDPEAEEAETRLKASAMIDAIRRADAPAPGASSSPSPAVGAGRKILMVDHEDSFVHMLGAYFRETGAEVVTLRAGFAVERVREIAPDLVVLSPGPGRPDDHGMRPLIAAVLAEGVPLFGVCLGLQGVVEFFGGRLETFAQPVHGKPGVVRNLGGWLLDGLADRFDAGRYHSLYAAVGAVPSELLVTARTDDGAVMAVEHVRLAVAAVQFHPESILTLEGDAGRLLIRNVVARLGGDNATDEPFTAASDAV